MRACVAELIATFTLTFVGAGAIIVGAGGTIVAGGTPGSSELLQIALAHGLALSVAVYASGHISGAHINPAVTIAMLVTKKIEPVNAVGYIIAQLAGSTLGALVLKTFLAAEAVTAVKLGATLGSPESQQLLGVGGTFLFEAIFTFFLVTTIFAVAVDDRGPKNVYGFAIGLTIAADILIGGPLTGASMYPARSFGPAFVGGYWDMHWVYWAGPIVGGSVAAILYQTVQLSGKKDA